MLQGSEFFKDGEICFPLGAEEADGTYRTVFGPAVSHNGQIYGNTNHNFAYAARRLTGARCPDQPGRHEALFQNQTNFISNHHDFFDSLASSYAPHFDGYMGADLEALYHKSDPHPKRLLRERAFVELTEACSNTSDNQLWVKSVLWKLKKNEWAKFRKKPRSIGDLGVGASLLGFRLTHFLKLAQSLEDIEVNGGTITFCKSPDPFELERHFLNLLDPPGRFYYVYFSDDACLAIRNKQGGVDRYNLDISSCDASHGAELFRLLERVTPAGRPREDMKRLTAQCLLPLRIVSRANKNHLLCIKPKQETLYSGSTITTAINNLANICIGLSISELDYDRKLDDTGSNSMLVQAADRCGYIVTGTNPLVEFEDVQFLKNSPVLDTRGNWRPLINFGVFLRASGTCNGDLPGKGSLKPRAEAFQRGLLACTFPSCTSEVIDIMRRTMGTGPVTMTSEMVENLRYKTSSNESYPKFTIETESFCNRYRLDPSEYADLRDYASLGFGAVYNGPSVSKILAKDYDLSTVEYDAVPYLLTHYNSDKLEALV